jgi:cell division protein ZapA (FtsZ GTPase activity inhibitor)
MADLKPIGSEKLQGQEKISRILEIARYKENIPSNVNENSRTEFAKTLADGQTYEIVKEKLGYVIKQHVNESLDYVEPMKNRKYYKSYSQALKRLNLMAGEINRLTENQDEVSMFNLGEQKKFKLKLPKQEMPAPALEPAPEMDAELPDDGDMSLDADNTELPGGEEDINVDMNMDVEEPAPSEEEEVDFKVIQKLTGKLGQKIRTMNESVGMTSEDVKYVINSILSALDLSKLDETDKEDILAKFEEDSDYGMEGDDMDLEISGDEELDMEPETSEAMGASSAGQYSAPLFGEEMGEGDLRDKFDGRDSKVIGVYSNIKKQRNEEMSEEEKTQSHISKIMDSVFGESKVDRVLSKYFVMSENEKKSPVNKKLERIAILSESEEQKLAAQFIVNENKNLKFLGKTNKNNLVFESNDIQVKVSPKGEIL